MIKIGEKIPNSVLRIKTEIIQKVNSEDFFKNKKIVLFGVPGAFTPTCSAKHLPDFINYYSKIIEKGIDKICCLSVNDPHVMKAWGEHNNTQGKIEMISDTDCSFSKKIGLDHDYGEVLGLRCLRFSMIVKNSVLKKIFVDELGKFEVTGAENIINNL